MERLCSPRGPLDFIERCRIFQGRCVAEFFAQIRSAHNAAHHFRVPRFWYVCHKNHVARSERLTEIACHIFFQFGRKSDIAVRSLLQNAKTTNRSAFIESGAPHPTASFALRMRTKDYLASTWP